MVYLWFDNCTSLTQLLYFSELTVVPESDNLSTCHNQVLYLSANTLIEVFIEANGISGNFLFTLQVDLYIYEYDEVRTFQYK